MQKRNKNQFVLHRTTPYYLILHFLKIYYITTFFLKNETFQIIVFQ